MNQNFSFQCIEGYIYFIKERWEQNNEKAFSKTSSSRLCRLQYKR